MLIRGEGAWVELIRNSRIYGIMIRLRKLSLKLERSTVSGQQKALIATNMSERAPEIVRHPKGGL